MAIDITDKFFQFLRYSMGASADIPADISSEEWECIYDMAQRQSLLGIIFYGLKKLPVLKPSKHMVAKMYLVSEDIKRANQKTNKVAVKLTERFAKKSFMVCVLKGQGNTLYYPDPYIRTSGDVDIWLGGGASLVLDFVRRYVDHPKFCYHHVDFKKIGGVSCEVHYRPSFMNNLICNRRMQRWFDEMADEQFRHWVDLPEGAGRICVPTHAFNRIYQMAHISKHFFQDGIGLRHMMDYYFLLKQGVTEQEKQVDEQLFKQFGLYKMASAVMYVLGEVFHLEKDLMIVSPNRHLGELLLNEIMIAGNLGQFDERVNHHGTPFYRNIQRLKRDLHMVWYFPSECLWEPFFRIYHFFWRFRHSDNFKFKNRLC